MSLVRFLTGSRFKDFELSLNLEERTFLLEGIISGLEARLGKTDEFACAALAYLETRVNDSRYTDGLALGYLAGIYGSIGGSRAEALLHGLQEFQGNPVERKLYGFVVDEISPPAGHPGPLMFFQKATRYLNPTLSRALGKLVLRVASRFPGYQAWNIRNFKGRS